MSIQKNESMLVSDIMLPLNEFPVISEKMILKEALEMMAIKRLGIASIVNEENRLLGIITDGDLRRKMLKVQKPFSAFLIDDALDHSIQLPITVDPEQTLWFAVEKMEEKQVWDLPVVDTKGILVGLLHLQHAVKVLLGKQ
jgi:DeoR family transcriptional regulator, catabolite repression regulator